MLCPIWQIVIELLQKSAVKKKKTTTLFIFCVTFFLLTVAAHVGVVAVEGSRCGVGTTAVILGIQCVDGDVD